MERRRARSEGAAEDCRVSLWIGCGRRKSFAATCAPAPQISHVPWLSRWRSEGLCTPTSLGKVAMKGCSCSAAALARTFCSPNPPQRHQSWPSASPTVVSVAARLECNDPVWRQQDMASSATQISPPGVLCKPPAPVLHELHEATTPSRTSSLRPRTVNLSCLCPQQASCCATPPCAGGS